LQDFDSRLRERIADQNLEHLPLSLHGARFVAFTCRLAQPQTQQNGAVSYRPVDIMPPSAAALRNLCASCTLSVYRLRSVLAVRMDRTISPGAGANVTVQGMSSQLGPVCVYCQYA
jgi:hypothetical protein